VRLTIRQRYEKHADEWDKAGRPDDFCLGDDTLDLIAMYC